MDWLGCLKAIVGLLPCVDSKVTPHVVYPFKVSRNVKDMKEATEKLIELKRDVENEIENAERGTATNRILGWLGRVGTIETESRDIDNKYQQLCRCIWNISPNLYSNYKISKRAEKYRDKATDLYKEKSTIPVIAMLPPQGQEMPASSSKSPYLESVLDYVKADVNGIIGIWGMGGVGKTHLLEQINNALCKDHASKIFVVHVECPKECDEENVQNTIIEKLGLSKSDNREVKQLTIYNFLREKSFVLLLDNLWKKVDLKTIGIPDPMEAAGLYKRKVILTTRSERICKEMKSRNKIKLDGLDWEDAWSLFKTNVSEETINSHPLIEKLAMDVAKKIGGLPLALITVGLAMYDKKVPDEWMGAVKQLKPIRSTAVELSDVYTSVFETLSFSYDSLKTDGLKKCFLHCSLWPQGDIIMKNDLVELWMGLGLIDSSTLEDAFVIGYNYIGTLQTVSLLEIVDDNFTKMHDVIHDMALWIANDKKEVMNKWIVGAGEYKRGQQIVISSDTEIVSIRGLFFSITDTSTKLTTLRGGYKELRDSGIQLISFSELTYLDLSLSWLNAFPVEICNLVHLQFLNLSYNINLGSLLPEKLGALTKLKYLLLRETRCTLPQGVLLKLKALRVLDLSNFYKYSYSISAFVEEIFVLPKKMYPMLEEDLKHLHNFQALGISISGDDFNHVLSKNVSVPVRWLDVVGYDGSYISFSSSFLGNSQLRRNLFSLRIRSCKLASWVEFESASEHQSNCCLERLDHLSFEWMERVTEIKWNSLEPKDVFPRLRVLKFWDIPHLTSISWVINLPCIRELYVINCRSIKQLFSIDEQNKSEINVSQHSFPSLKRMYLSLSGKLVRISDFMITFPVLESLEINHCKNLKKLPFKTGDPPKRLKYIIGSEEWWDNVEMEDSTHRSSLQLYYRNVYTTLVASTKYL
ncbi:Disease resistance protein RPS5 [Rhynchospora pubera]|uniref:Disease resistance protein RPS5 n=1 Tax=Rhynchospora pubera TaxID=906938 RepID=A0AAV8G720_9POAL|nr:Disease resistance protein RPS5 [Rhynchospora pubera]